MLRWTCGKDFEVDEIHKTYNEKIVHETDRGFVIMRGVKAMKPGAIFVL